MTNERTEHDPTRLDERRSDAPERDRDAERPDDRGRRPDQPNPLLREGADAPDAADIESPEEQR